MWETSQYQLFKYIGSKTNTISNRPINKSKDYVSTNSNPGAGIFECEKRLRAKKSCFTVNSVIYNVMI